MLNDNREAHDAGSDALRASEEELSDFANIGDEGGNMHEYLKPGDLVALASYVCSVGRRKTANVHQE